MFFFCQSAPSTPIAKPSFNSAIANQVLALFFSRFKNIKIQRHKKKKKPVAATVVRFPGYYSLLFLKINKCLNCFIAADVNSFYWYFNVFLRKSIIDSLINDSDSFN